MDNQNQSQAPAPAPAAPAPAAQAQSKAVEHLSHLGLGLTNMLARGAADVRRSQRHQAFVGLLFVVALVWLFGSVAYRHIYKNFTPPATAPAATAPQAPAPVVQAPAPEPVIVRVPIPVPAEAPKAKSAIVLFEDGWVWDTPIGIKVGDKTHTIPKSQRSRFNVSEAEEIPQPASLESWPEMPKDEQEGLYSVKVYLVG